MVSRPDPTDSRRVQAATEPHWSTHRECESAEAAKALRSANVPTLLAVLYQLTGDDRWISEEFRPTRSRGMDVNDSGGLPVEKQEEIRDAALAAWLKWEDDKRPAYPTLADDQLHVLLTHVNGEPVPTEYADMMAEIIGISDAQEAASPLKVAGPVPDVLVIGAGVSGMLTSLRLTQAGVPHTVIEKNSEVGGSWWENTYPGAGVDTPSYLYSYSCHPWPWSTFFGKRDEVQAYMQDFATTYDLHANIQFGTEATRLEFDDAENRWNVHVEGPHGAEVIHAKVVVSGVGFLNRPKIPPLEGFDSFEGPIFHSACWPEGLDMAGQRVAIVGSGASAMQIGPAIAASTASLTIFQRSPQWIAPSADYFEPVSTGVHWLMEHVPFYSGWYRAKLNWIFNDRVHSTLKVDPEWPHAAASVNAINDRHRDFYTKYLRSELGDREDLVEKSLPTYPPFGKRMLLDNGWYRMLRQDNVALVAEAVERVTSTGLVSASGEHREFDVVILATGFHSDKYLHPMEVVGRDGVKLSDVWADDEARAYLGMTVPSFPNLFIIGGPNTGLGHGGSFISIAEAQVRYIMQALTHMVNGGHETIECREEVYATYNKAIDKAHAELVWTHPGMSNWYRNQAGRVIGVLPWRIVDYWMLTRTLRPEDFVCDSDTTRLDALAGGESATG